MNKLATLAAGALISAAAAAHAATITVTATEDTTLNGFSDFQGNNMGAGDWMNVGFTGNNAHMRGLMKFDLAGQVPAGATVTAAKVNVSVIFTPPNGPGSIFELHRVLQNWIEGNKGAGADSLSGDTATAGEPTWLQRASGGTPWGQPGAFSATDIVLQSSSTVGMTNVARYSFPSTPALVADVQGWVNNASSNFGWLINSASTAARTARRLGSRESTASTRPTIEITYTLPLLDLIITEVRLVEGGVFLAWSGGTTPYRVQRSDALGGEWSFVTTASTTTNAIAPLGEGFNLFRIAGSAP